MIRTQNSAVAEMERAPDAGLSESFMAFLAGDSYPCVGAKAASARGAIETHEFDTMGHQGNDRTMLDGLSEFVQMIESTANDDSVMHSYVALFRGPFDMDELRFESSMWSQLWRVHELDVAAGNLPADDVSDDTDSARFSLSMAGHPFFVIGLHPNASRLARRFSHPAIVFNSHRQFEKLREDGRFEKMQAATRSRAIDLQGSLNPNLANYGESSEARQYSGRALEAAWQCPHDFGQKQ